MTLGAPIIAAVPATAAAALPATVRNLRRAVITSPSDCDEPVIGALGDVIPGAHQGLELRERRMHLPGHGRFLRFLRDHLSRQLLEITQDRCREGEDLDLALEFCLELRKRDRVLRMEVGVTIDLAGGGGMIDRAPQIDRESLVRLLVEAEVEHRA